MANTFVRLARKVYHPLGFSKGYNFILFFTTAGALMGFTLARLMYIGFDTVYCASGYSATDRAIPGECYYFRKSTLHRVGIIMHLAAILPAAFLVCFQFVPVIRHKAIMVHRVNGYLVLILSFVGTVAVYLFLRNAVGGSPTVQAASGALGIVFLTSLGIAYYNIKRLQIEQHRAWMIRSWAYAGSIVIVRPILGIASLILSSSAQYWEPFPCKVIEYLVSSVGPVDRMRELYPACNDYMDGKNDEQYTLVLADLGDDKSPAGAAAALHLGFGVGMVLSFLTAAAFVEFYLQLTPAETERLRKISYERQLAAGMRHPGSAGLTADRVGDAEAYISAEKPESEIVDVEVAKGVSYSTEAQTPRENGQIR